MHPRAGTLAQPADLVDLSALVTAYYTEHPDPSVIRQRVAFGTSGHRGSSLSTSFNDDHIAATTQAICEYREAPGHRRPAVHRQGHPRALRAGDGAPRSRCSPPTA